MHISLNSMNYEQNQRQKRILCILLDKGSHIFSFLSFILSLARSPIHARLLLCRWLCFACCQTTGICTDNEVSVAKVLFGWCVILDLMYGSLSR